MRHQLVITNLCIFAISSFAAAADWASFRGPNGNGTTHEQKVPLEWSADKNIKWKVALPQPSNGSPIVSNGCVFVAGCEDKDGLKRSLYCFDRRDGKQLWVRTVDYGKKETTHGTNPHGSSTPAANGKQVVVFHSSAGLYCYDFAGKELWSRQLGEFQHMWGDGTSPLIYNDRVIMHCGPGAKIFVTALELATGKTIWTSDEPLDGNGNNRKDKAPMGSWSTPLIAKVGGQDQIICMLPTRVVGYSPADGKILWSCEGIRGPKGDLAYSSPVISDDICVCVGGYGGPGMGFKLGGSGDITPSRLWRVEASPQSIGSAVAIDGYIYRPSATPGKIECLDPDTGKVLWSDRATGGELWSSIVYAANRCYLTNQEGNTVVFKPNPDKFELLATNKLDERSNSTPAISDGEIFLSTHEHLYCVAEK
jgi:outer membrane protein assembly factor BamB